MILTEEQKLIQQTARQFAQNVLSPRSADFDKSATMPADIIKQMAQLGLMGMLLPQHYDGVEADHIAYALALEEIAAGDGAASTIMSVHNSVACKPILDFGSTIQKETYLRKMASGEILGAFCLTEPNAGSDAAALQTTAQKKDGYYELNGTKQFITNGKSADLAIVFARTGEGKKGISAFLVPTDNPGYQVASTEAKLGQKASDTCQIVFDRCRIGIDQLLGEEGQGYKIALSNLEGGRIGIAAQSLGMARKAYELALLYSQQRTSFNKPIIEHQAIAFKLADMATQIAASRALILTAAQLKDHQQPCLQEASMAKLFASEMAEKVCSDAIQLHGGYGYLTDYGVEQIYRDVRVCQLYEGTSEIQRLVISRSINQ